jgi:putative DNA primase/helicase
MPPRNPERAALAYARLGWAVFPLTPGTKIPLKGSRGCLDASTDPATIRRWWAAHPTANIGLACGLSGLVAIDLDAKNGRDGPASWEHLKHQCGDVDDSAAPISQTPSGGLHVLFAANGDKIGNSAGKLGDGIDVRGDGGYIVLPPSVLEDGSRYAWQDGRKPTDCTPPPLPGALAELLTGGNGARSRPSPSAPIHAEAYARAALQGELGKLAAATVGERNNTLNAAAFSLGQLVGAGALVRGDMESRLLAVALAVGLGERESLAAIRNGLDAGEQQPRAIPAPTSRPAEPPPEKYPGEVPDAEPAGEQGADAVPNAPDLDGFALTDLGNAERLASRHGRDLRFCDPWGKWLVWDGQRWKQDDLREIDRRANETVRAIYHAAGSAPDPDRRAALGKWAGRSEATARRRAMIDDARALPPIPILPDALDADPWLLAVANGTVDLRTGELCAHRRRDLITKLAPVTYDPDARAPAWAAFLERVFAGDGELIGFLRRAVGYSLTGQTGEQVFFILHGTGANGKSTLLEALGAMLGDYGAKTPTETLLIKRSAGISNDVARLRGARLVTAVEAEDGQRLAESLVKQLTGGDTITARFLYQEAFEFAPTFKLWLATNHKPTIRGTDYAIWRRIRLIPFAVTIPEKEQDRTLPDKLKAELPGILAWAVRGCLEWQREGLGLPEAVKAATAAYQVEQDTLAAWLDACCILSPTATARAGQLYKNYRAWAEENGERPMTGHKFGRTLTERGFDKYKDRAGWAYVGLGVADSEENELPI